MVFRGLAGRAAGGQPGAGAAGRARPLARRRGRASPGPGHRAALRRQRRDRRDVGRAAAGRACSGCERPWTRAGCSSRRAGPSWARSASRPRPRRSGAARRPPSRSRRRSRRSSAPRSTRCWPGPAPKARARATRRSTGWARCAGSASTSATPPRWRPSGPGAGPSCATRPLPRSPATPSTAAKCCGSRKRWRRCAACTSGRARRCRCSMRSRRPAFEFARPSFDPARLAEPGYAQELVRTVELLHGAIPPRARTSGFSAYRAPTAGPSVIPPRV